MKSVTFKSCFAPFWLVPASATKFTDVDLLFSFFEDFKPPASGFLALIFVCVDCDFWKEPFHVNGGAVVLPERVAFSVVAVHGGFIVNASLYSQGEFLDAIGSQEVLLERRGAGFREVVRRGRRRSGAAGTPTLSSWSFTTLSASTTTATFGRSSST